MAQEVESYSFVDWPVQVFAVDYAGDLVALPGRGGVAVLDLSKGISCVGKIIRQSKWDCSAIEWNPHQNHRCQLASTSNQKIELWTWEDGGGKKLQDLRAHTRSVSCLNWSRFDPRLLATCSFDSFIYLWDLRDTRKPKPLSTVSGASHLKWNSADSHVLATTHDGDVRIWDMRKGNMPVHYIAAHLSKINGLDWSPVDGNKLMTCSQDSLVKLWDLGKDTRIPNAVCDHRASVWRAKYTPKAPGNAILTVPLSTASQGTINVPSLWDISNLKSPFQTFYGITSVLEFHWRLSHVDDGYQLLTWSRDQMLKLWNLDPRCWKMTDALKDHKEQSVINSRPSEYLPVSSFGENGRDNKSSNENMIINLNMKPSKFSEEIAQVCKTVRGVVWEEIDLDNRCCTVSMNIRTNHLKIKIAFPEFYPSVAPSFELIDVSIDSLMKTEITKLLDKEALLCLGNNEFCLEKCLISLILYAEDLMAHDRRLTNSIHPFSPYDAMYSNEMEGAEGRNDYSTPFPRTSGACFTANGLLICFNGSLRSLMNTPRSLSALSSFHNSEKQKTSIKSKELSSGRYVTLFDASSLTNLNRLLCHNYRIFDCGNPKNICEKNKNSATQENRADLVQAWSLLGLIFDSDLQPSLSALEMQWAIHPFGRRLIKHMIRHYLSLHDVQMMAMISCLLEYQEIGEKKKQEELEEHLSNFDGEMASSVSPFCRESHSPFFTIIDFPEKEERECHENNSKFVKKEERRLYEHYKLTYVDLLYKCELKTRRNEVLKFVLDPQKFFFDKEYALKGQFCHDNSQSSKLLIRNNKHSKLQCVICRIAVKGMFNLCFSCGHGGHTLHLLKWFETNSVCAGGCGCQCLRKDAFKL